MHSGLLLAELGRMDEARKAVADSLVRFPDMSIENRLGHGEYFDWQIERMTESMRKAGFPVCANENVLKEFPNLIRMPECVQSSENPGAPPAN